MLTKEAPSARVGSPPQQQFAFRNVDQSAQDGSRRTYFPENVTQPSNLTNIYAQDSWTTSFTTNEPIGLNPIINGNMNMNNFDTEMSDQANNSNSTGLTPGSSGSYNHSSSNPSFTPPGDDQVTTQAASMPILSGAYTSYATVFTPPAADNRYNAQPSGLGPGTANARSPAANGIAHEQADPFKMPTGWDLPPTTPGGMSGMTPEGGWEKMMESWDRGG